MTPIFLRRTPWAFVALVAAAGCGAENRPEKVGAAAEAETPSTDTKDVGKIAYGKTSATLDYSNPPRYRALKFTGQAGDAVDAWVRSTDGDAMGWLVDDAFNVIAENDDADASTMDSHLTATLPATPTGVFRVVFREWGLANATFAVHLDGAPGGAPIDAGSPDASSPDASAPPDAAGPDAMPPVPSGTVTCGGVLCRTGQACTADRCAYECSGVHVPGDYATLQNAVNAQAAVGGTVCVGGTTLGEAVHVTLAGKPVMIIGLGPELTTIDSIAVAGSGSFELRGATLKFGASIAEGTPTSNVSARFVGSRLLATSWSALSVLHLGDAITVDVDGCELAYPASARAGYGISLSDRDDLGSPPMVITIANSYIHGADKGLTFGSNSTRHNPLNARIRLLNDTFADNNTALGVAPLAPGMILEYSNDLFVGNDTSVSLTSPSPVTITHGHNAFTRNGTNFAGLATIGPGYFTGDAKIDTSTPPIPLAGSPLIGAGDATIAPDRDYYGARRTTAGIGAVEYGAVPGVRPPPADPRLPIGTFRVMGALVEGAPYSWGTPPTLTIGPSSSGVFQVSLGDGIVMTPTHAGPGAYVMDYGISRYRNDHLEIVKDTVGPAWHVYWRRITQPECCHSDQRMVFQGWITP